MTNIDKFYADVQRIKKYDRANNPCYDGLRVCKQVAELFESCNRDLNELPKSICDYWMENYISPSSDKDSEPTEEHIEWLITVLSFFDGDLGGSKQDLSKKDWNAIKELINYEAETLPIEVLTDLMRILVEKDCI